MTTFHDRKREIAQLDAAYHRSGGQMFVLYGRRRTGKTALLTHWIQIRRLRAFFWTADRKAAPSQIRDLSLKLQQFIRPGQPIPADFTYGAWEVALDEIARLAERERLVVVLDEFTYLIESDPSLPSILQRVWDHRLKAANIFLILTGSHAGMIAREVLGYRSPLYQRAAFGMHLLPLPYAVLADFFPNYSPEDRVKTYACLGGVPSYLELIDPEQPIDDNLRQLLSSKLIIDDAGTLLRDQLGEASTYVSIVGSIAAGLTRFADIAKMSDVQETSLGKYLGTLEKLGIAAREVPATVTRPDRSKQGRYTLTDPYLRFYYRFLSPNRTDLEQGLVRQAWANIAQHLPGFIGSPVFEELCREWVRRMADAGRLPFVPRRVGSYWGAKAPQIDVVAMNEDAHAILVGECKWTVEPVGRSVVETHIAQTASLVPEPADRWTVFHAFFSRAGFTREARNAGRGHNCLWLSLDQLDRDLRQLLREDNVPGHSPN